MQYRINILSNKTHNSKIQNKNDMSCLIMTKEKCNTLGSISCD